MLLYNALMTTPEYRIYLCHGPFCRGETLRTTLINALEQANLTAHCDVRASGCQGRCDDGPNLTIWPGPIRYCRLTHHHVTTIVNAHLGQQHIVEALLHPSSLRTLPE